MLTGIELFLARLITGYDPHQGTSDGDSFVYSHWKEEFTLWYGSLLLSALLLPLLLPAMWMGDRIGGRHGYLIGTDIVFGVVGFAVAGMFLHAVRVVALRIYWIVTVRTLSGPDPYPRLQPPPHKMQWLMVTTSGDAAFQVLCGIGVAGILLWFQP